MPGLHICMQIVNSHRSCDVFTRTGGTGVGARDNAKIHSRLRAVTPHSLQSRTMFFCCTRCTTVGYPEVCGVFFLSRVEYERGVRGGARLLPHACAARTSPVVGPLLKISTRGWARTARPEGRVRAVSHAGNSGRAHQGPARCRYTSAVTQVPTVRVPRTVH